MTTGAAPPSRGPTLRDVASRAGVPLSAASLVLNGKPGVSAERKDRVLRAVADLGYVPQRRDPASAPPALVGLVMEALSPAAARDGFMTEVLAGVEAGLRAAGLAMLLHLHRGEDDPVAELRRLVGRDVDAVIVANGGDVGEAVIDRVLATGTPTVLLENYLDAPVHAVVADNFAAGYRCTRALLERGHRRIAMLAGSTRYVGLTDRRRGHEAALTEAGIPVDPALVPPQPAGTERKGYDQMRTLLALPDRPTAVYAVSDRTAIGAYAALADAGLRVPDDVSVIGTDDIVESALLSPPLSTFVVPTFELGRAAARTVVALLGDEPPAPSRTILLGRLELRGSVRDLR
ncbi:LacI family DNA-binding transcriptional regulator [Microlunatus spumicola]|uniref:LacI family DNA-binding transcriptional regulator n=1 Tax=Microlunatus spumicola TaxID=81499 RepID=A0ABP6WJ09_9ACTN